MIADPRNWGRPGPPGAVLPWQIKFVYLLTDLEIAGLLQFSKSEFVKISSLGAVPCLRTKKKFLPPGCTIFFVVLNQLLRSNVGFVKIGSVNVSKSGQWMSQNRVSECLKIESVSVSKSSQWMSENRVSECHKIGSMNVSKSGQWMSYFNLEAQVLSVGACLVRCEIWLKFNTRTWTLPSAEFVTFLEIEACKAVDFLLESTKLQLRVYR